MTGRFLPMNWPPSGGLYCKLGNLNEVFGGAILRELDWECCAPAAPILVIWSFSEFFSAERCSRHRRKIESGCSVTRIGATTQASQESRTGPISRGETVVKERAFGGSNLEGAYAVANQIRKSSIRFPDLSCAVSQRGFFPRPAQVSDGSAGFLYFGKTCG